MRKLLLIGIVYFSTFLPGVSQDERLVPTDNFTVSDGLAHNGVTALLQDSRGYYWASTYDGLSRYDGYSFQTIKNSIHKEFFVSNRIRTIHEDTSGRLWLGTDGGITVYDVKINKFINVYSNDQNAERDKGPIVRKIINVKDKGVICATEGEGLLLFDSDYKLVEHFNIGDESGNPVLFFDGLYFHEDYLFSTSVGLIRFNIESGEFTKILADEVEMSNTLVQLDQDHILVGLNYGMVIIKMDKDNDFQNGSILFDQFRFRDFSLDKSGYLWLGTFSSGLIAIRNIKNVILGEEPEISIFDLTTDVLRTSAVYPSKDHGLWLSTYNHGIYRFDLAPNPFKLLTADNSKPLSIQSNEVLYLSNYDSNKILISANHGGVALFNTMENTFESIPFMENREFRGGFVFVDSDKRIWIGHPDQRGLTRYSPQSKKILQIDKISLNERNIQSMYEDLEGDIWIGTFNNLYRLKINDDGEVVSLETLGANEFFSDKRIFRVRDIHVDEDARVAWAATQNIGLIRIDISKDITLENATIAQFVRDKNDTASISSNFITSIHKTNDELYIGTEGGGFCKIENRYSEKPNFVTYTKERGLSNDVVKSVLSDDHDDLWVATNHGLNRFSVVDGSILNFYKADGLPFDDFLYASAKQINGKLVFAGTQGLIYVNPSDISYTRPLPKIQFDNLRVNGQLVQAGDSIGDRVLIDFHLGDMEELNLKHSENVFSIDLMSLHYENPVNYRIRHRLDPVGKEWIEIPSGQKTINYHGLEPGNYTLRVSGSNSLNDWTEEKTLAITISAPYWKTTMAYIIYLALIGLLVYSIILIVLKFQSLNHKVELEHMELETSKKINAAKLRYFSNISHEIKTPITLMTGPIDYLKDKFSSSAEVVEKLELVNRQSKKIIHLVDQVHDFQRSEANLLHLEPSHFSFDEFIMKEVDEFEFIAHADHKNLSIEKEESPIFIYADRDKLEKIFNNLLSNAFKFTKDGDTIVVKYWTEGKSLHVVVKDSGTGIDANEVDRIFDRFYQVDESKHGHSGGAGIGLAFAKRLVDMHYGFIHAESEKGEGTEFHLKLPIIDSSEPNEQAEKKMQALESEENTLVNVEVDEKGLDEIEICEESRGARIFLAEDNSDMRAFLEEMLSKYFNVKSYVNGQECLNAMEEEWPELLITDVSMPEMNGFDLCQSVKSDIKTSHIPVIILTALSALDDQIQGIEVGADSYIQKPFDIKHLVKRVDSLLESRRKLRARFQMDLPLVLEGEVDGNDAVFLEKLYSLMDEQLDNDEVDINSFATELYLNRSYFFRKVKALTDQTPFMLLKHYRLKKAAEMLKLGKVSVKEVFLETGFKSRTHFSRSFKEYFGKSPGKYVSMGEENNIEDQVES